MQRRKHSFWQAKQKVKEFNYKYIWTNNGQIFATKNEIEHKIIVKTENYQKSRKSQNQSQQVT